LPHLRSLTYNISNDDFWYDPKKTAQMCAHELREKTRFLFQYNGDSISAWIYQAAYEDPCWQTFPVKPSQSIAKSITTANPDSTKKKKRKFSFLKFFKN